MDKKAMFDEITRWSQPQPPEDDEFDLPEYQDYLETIMGTRLRSRTVRARLNVMIEKGILGKRWAFVNGERRVVYRSTGLTPENSSGGNDREELNDGP